MLAIRGVNKQLSKCAYIVHLVYFSTYTLIVIYREVSIATRFSSLATIQLEIKLFSSLLVHFKVCVAHSQLCMCLFVLPNVYNFDCFSF